MFSRASVFGTDVVLGTIAATLPICRSGAAELHLVGYGSDPAPRLPTILTWNAWSLEVKPNHLAIKVHRRLMRYLRMSVSVAVALPAIPSTLLAIYLILFFWVDFHIVRELKNEFATVGLLGCFWV
ncbi:hypothetical protein OH492_18185 [Vibrio chagasii]|nr:hypothetical protein [Vibrio chagasii]